MTKQRVIVITGVTRGLGRALVEAFVEAGHLVCGCGRDAAQIDALGEQFSQHDFAVVDITDEPAVAAWADHIVTARGAPQLLLNNAAMINSSQELWRVPSEEFAQLFAVNVAGTHHMIRHFVPPMIAATSEDGAERVIANFSSGWGRSTSPEVVPYCASKWAIEGLTRGLAQELPRGLAAVALNPGIINTDMLQQCFGGMASAYPSPVDWAERAAPFILGLGAGDNGSAVTVPD